MRHTTVTAAMLMIMGLSSATAEENPALAPLMETVKAAEGMDEATKTLVSTVLLPVSVHETIATAVTAQNAKGMSLDDIKKTDEAWKDAEEELDIMVELTSNDTAKAIAAIIEANPTIVEAFAMDNQGANVGQNALTSDYWQGDEAKWQNSFAEGKGGIDVGEVEFDKSAEAYLQQISLPVYDAKGTVIGAITWGLKVEKTEKSAKK